MKKLCTAVMASLCALTISSVAAADVDQSLWDKDGGYHIFKDDPLTAPGAVPGGENIKVRKKAFRSYLIRPRTSFVPEMLKSVEKM